MDSPVSTLPVTLILLGPKARYYTSDKALEKINTAKTSWAEQKELKDHAEFYHNDVLVAAYKVTSKGRKPMDLRRYKQKGDPRL